MLPQPNHRKVEKERPLTGRRVSSPGQGTDMLSRWYVQCVEGERLEREQQKR